jgi:hypothetical protein
MSRVRMPLSIALLAVALTSSIGLHADEGPSPYAAWSLGSFGEQIGVGGLLIVGTGSQTEIYVASKTGYDGGYAPYWFTVRHIPGTAQYEQLFISETFTQDIRRIMRLRTPVAERPLAIAVAFADGTIRLYDPTTKALLGTDSDPCTANGGILAITTSDLDGNGWDEFVSLCGNGAVAVHGFTYSQWVLPGSASVFAGDIITGQMDDDPAIEIATTEGKVIDAATHAVQWSWTPKFGRRLRAADIDADGRDELIGAEAWYTVFAYDVERQLPKWSLPADLDIGAIEVTDIDADGVQELLVGDSQWGEVHAYSTVTQAEEWKIANPEHGVTNIAVGDVNNDGIKEVLWGAGASSTGADRLYVGNWMSRTISWQNIQLDGPFVGPAVGDLDGDGIAELVYVSMGSEAGYASGRIVVVDSRTMKVRAVSPGVAGGTNAWTGVKGLKLRNLVGDSRPEIVVATGWLYDGLIEAYSFNSANAFSMVWTNLTRPNGVSFASVEVADIDGDGGLEVLAGSDAEHTGSIGEFIYVYDAATRAEKFHTLQMGARYSKISDLVVGQLDSDPAMEFAGLVDGGAVYVFDGKTRILDALIDVKGTSLASINPSYGIGSLLVGTTTGRVSAYAFNGSIFTERLGWNFGTLRITGAALTPDGALAVGTGGVIHVLREGVSFQTRNYGAGFGHDLLSMGGGRVLLSGGGLGVHAFIVRP